jgi:hypothetical protein
VNAYVVPGVSHEIVSGLDVPVVVIVHGFAVSVY